MNVSPKMLRVMTIEPSRRHAQALDVPSLESAYRCVGLDIGEIDHGAVLRDGTVIIGIAVFEWSLLRSQPWFAIGPSLFAGNAVIYQESMATGQIMPLGKTWQQMITRNVKWFATQEQVEQAILRGQILRPRTRVDDVTTWEFGRQ